MLWLGNNGILSAALPASLPAAQLDWWPIALDAPQEARRCGGAYQPPTLDLPEASLPWSQARLFIQTPAIKASAATGLKLAGPVRLRQGPVQLLAEDGAKLNATHTQAELMGAIEWRQPHLLLRSYSGQVDFEQQTLYLGETHFVLHEQQLRGAAWQFEQQADGRLVLIQAGLTSCPPDDSSWRLVAQRLVLDQSTGFGDAWHVRMEIHQVPVFYWPWLRFPLDDRRHTGLLTPNLGYAKATGWDVIQPLYLNIAADADATLYPRYIEQRGAMLGIEGRYLQSQAAGVLFYAHLAQDQRAQRERWHLSWQHQGQAGQALTYWVHLDQVSDGDYFHDLAFGRFAEQATNTSLQNTLLQEVGFIYRWQAWQFSAIVQGHQQLHLAGEAQFKPLNWRAGRRAGAGDYYRLPQLTLTTQQQYNQWQWQWLSELTYFDPLFDSRWSEPEQIHPQLRPVPMDTTQFYVTDWGAARAWRLHLEPRVSREWRWPSAYIRPELGIRYNHYWLDPEWSTEQANLHLDTRPDVWVPTASLDIGISVQRNLTWRGQAFQHRLEPRIFTAYIPFVEQYHLPHGFDSSLDAFDFNQLYRAERSSGRDRLADIQKTTLGFTQRLIHQGRERGHLAVAREFYWADRRLDETLLHPDEVERFERLPSTERPYEQVRQQSNVAARLLWQMSPAWQVTSQWLWDDQLNITDRSSTHLRYTQSQGHQLGVSHHYLSHYAQALRGTRVNRQALEQSGWRYAEHAEEYAALHALYVLDEHWRFFATLGYDLKRREALNQLAGLEYTHCCWQVQLLGRHWVKDIYAQPTFEAERWTRREQNYGILLQFEFKGLGSAGQSTQQLLQRSLPGYTVR